MTREEKKPTPFRPSRLMAFVITGEAEDENGNLFPAALIRAGDRIVISDSGDTTERTIVSTSYDHSSLTCTASIGATPDSLEALLGQLAAATDLIGQ